MSGRLYDWVDADPQPSEQGFSPRRVSKLFIAIIFSSIIGGLPILMLQVSLLWIENAKKEAERQEQLQKAASEMAKAVREGTAGEATRRLFGIEDARPRKDEKNLPATMD